jgi:hypothetical protein
MNLENLVREVLLAFGVEKWAILPILFAAFVYRQWKTRTEKIEKERSDKIERFLEKFPNVKGPNKAIMMEQLFLDSFGKALSYPEIQFFLSTKRPTDYIRCYLNGRPYFERYSESIPTLKKKYATEARLTFAMWHRNFWYFVCAALGLLLVLDCKQAFALQPSAWIVYLYFVFSFLFTSYLCLDASICVDSARRLHGELRLVASVATINDANEGLRWPWAT